MTLEALPAPRDRSRVLQRDAPRQLAEADAISDSMLRLVVNTSAALTAIDAQVAAIASVLGDRALVVDDNLQIMLSDALASGSDPACRTIVSATYRCL